MGKHQSNLLEQFIDRDTPCSRGMQENIKYIYSPLRLTICHLTFLLKQSHGRKITLNILKYSFWPEQFIGRDTPHIKRMQVFYSPLITFLRWAHKITLYTRPVGFHKLKTPDNSGSNYQQSVILLTKVSISCSTVHQSLSPEWEKTTLIYRPP